MFLLHAQWEHCDHMAHVEEHYNYISKTEQHLEQISNVPQNEPCDHNVLTGHIVRTFWKYHWKFFKWLPTVMGGYIWGTYWSYNPNTVKMFSPVPDWTYVVDTFEMCPICYYHEIAGLIQPKLSMFSTCNHWFQAPSPPVSVASLLLVSGNLDPPWHHVHIPSPQLSSQTTNTE